MAGFFDKILGWLRGGPARVEPEDDVVAPPTRAEFAALVAQAGTAAGAPELAFDADEFCLRGADGAVSWLHNRYDEYCTSASEQRAGMLRVWGAQLVPAQAEIASDWRIAAARLRPRIRSRAYHENVQLTMQLEGRPEIALSWVPLGDHLAIDVVYDLPTMMASVGPEQLARWEVSLDQALQQAIENLRRDPAPIAVATVEGGLCIVHVGDDYDSSRLLRPELLAGMELDGDPVALPASRGHLYVAGHRQHAALATMLSLADKVRQEPRLDTVQPLVFRQGSWHSWWPPADLPSAAGWREQILLDRAREHQQQKSLLEQVLERSGVDLFVGSYQVYRGDAGPFSLAMWVPVPSLLPEADQVLVKAPRATARSRSRGPACGRCWARACDGIPTAGPCAGGSRVPRPRPSGSGWRRRCRRCRRSRGEGRICSCGCAARRAGRPWGGPGQVLWHGPACRLPRPGPDAARSLQTRASRARRCRSSSGGEAMAPCRQRRAPTTHLGPRPGRQRAARGAAPVGFGSPGRRAS